MTRKLLVALSLACALAFPAAAMAQSAGDNQYQDPLASPHSNSSSGSSGGSGSSTSTPAPSSSGSTSGSGSSGTAGTSSAGTAATPSATATGAGLPRTGGHPELIGLLGVALLGGGLGLRRVLVTR